MRLAATTFVAVLVTSVAFSGAARAQMCADRSASQALDMRVLQSELMVAALTCNQRADYNAFVIGFKPFLKEQGRALRIYFTEAYGPTQGPKKLNSLVTRLANVASKGSLNQSTTAYCAQAEQRFRAVLDATPRMLSQMASANATADAHGVPSCLEVAEGASVAPEQN